MFQAINSLKLIASQYVESESKSYFLCLLAKTFNVIVRSKKWAGELKHLLHIIESDFKCHVNS